MSRDMAQVGWHRLSKRLTMSEVVEQLGWDDSPASRRRAMRWLARIQERSGKTVLWGGGGHGREWWTTLDALRSASPSLVEADKADAELLGDLEDQLLGVGIRLRALRAAVAENRRRIEALEAVTPAKDGAC